MLNMNQKSTDTRTTLPIPGIAANKALTTTWQRNGNVKRRDASPRLRLFHLPEAGEWKRLGTKCCLARSLSVCVCVGGGGREEVGMAEGDGDNFDRGKEAMRQLRAVGDRFYLHSLHSGYCPQGSECSQSTYGTEHSQIAVLEGTGDWNLWNYR